MKHPQFYPLFGTFFMMTGVALGALGAHALKELLTPESISSFETAVRYQLIHALALLILPSMTARPKQRIERWGGNLMIAGVFAFSGSIYLLSFKELLGSPRILDFIWPITPLGGLLLIGSWTLLFLSLMKRQSVS